jgi:hypothetical protein
MFCCKNLKRLLAIEKINKKWWQNTLNKQQVIIKNENENIKCLVT